MAFKFTVICDACGAEQIVPSPEHFPSGWMQLRWAAPNLTGQNGATKPEMKSVCGWRCLIKLAGGYVREEVNESRD